MKCVFFKWLVVAGIISSLSLCCHALESSTPSTGVTTPAKTGIRRPVMTWQERLDQAQAKYPQFKGLINDLRAKRTELETKESQIKPAMEARRAKAEQERMARLEEFKKVDPDRYNEIMAQETARKQKEPPAAQLTADQIKNAPAPAKLMEEVTKLRGEVGDLEKQLRTKIKSAKAK